MIERTTVRGEGDAVRGQEPAREGCESAPVAAVEMRACRLAGLVDGPGEEAARRVDAPVIEAARALVLRVIGELAGTPALPVEQPQAGPESCDAAAALREPDTADLFGHRNRVVPARRRPVAMERPA